MPYAEGSCLVSFGDTRVLCAATVEDGVPGWRKGSGLGWITAEYSMLPRSTRTRVARERGQLGGRTQEIQRLIGRSVRAMLDDFAFGEHTLRLDCDVVQADGGTRTAAITGACVAAVDAFAWMAETGRVSATSGQAAGGGGQCRHPRRRCAARSRVRGGREGDGRHECRHDRRRVVRRGAGDGRARDVFAVAA